MRFRLCTTNMHNLNRLVLSDNKIGKDEVIALNFPPGLKWLQLDKNNLGDNGAIALAQNLPPSLTLLTLKENGIGDEGAVALARNLPSSLVRLALDRNKIGVEGSEILFNVKTEKLTVYFDGAQSYRHYNMVQ